MVGEKQLFEFSHQHTHQSTKEQGCQNFQQGIDDDGNDIQFPALQSLCDAEGDRKDHQAHCVVQSYDREQQVRDRPFCLILSDNHQCCGRCCRRGDRAKGDCNRQRQLFRTEDEVKGDQGSIHQQRGNNGLDDADDRCGPAGFLQVGKPEFISDIKCDKAKCYVRENTDLTDILHGREPQAFDMKPPQGIWSDQQSCDQEARNVRAFKITFSKDTGHHQTRKQSNTPCLKLALISSSVMFSPT